MWSWVERDVKLLAEVNLKARKMKQQISIQKENNEKEERFLTKKKDSFFIAYIYGPSIKTAHCLKIQQL